MIDWYFQNRLNKFVVANENRLKLAVIFFCLNFQFVLVIPAIAAEESLEVRALLVPQSEAAISSQVAGKISNLPLKSGEQFKKGDLLVQFDCSTRLAQLERAQAELAKAEAIYRSNTMLFEMHSSSRLEVKVSEADVKRTMAEVGIVKTTIEYCSIKAPFDGSVIKLLVNSYEFVTEGQKLMDIVDIKMAEIQMFVPSAWIRWIKPQSTFSVSIEETEKTYPAKITRVVGKVDAVSQTIEAHGRFLKHHGELLSGMSGTAKFKK